MTAPDVHSRAPARPASQTDRPVAGPHPAAAGGAWRTAAPPAAGHPCRRHQWQRLDHRLHARDSGGRRLGVHVYTSPHLVPFASASGSPRRAAAGWFPTTRSGGGAGGGRESQCRPRRSPFSRRPRRRRSNSSPTLRPMSCLLEVGLGGRFDATNVIESPACAVITPISHRPCRVSRRYRRKDRL